MVDVETKDELDEVDDDPLCIEAGFEVELIVPMDFGVIQHPETLFTLIAGSLFALVKSINKEIFVIINSLISFPPAFVMCTPSSVLTLTLFKDGTKTFPGERIAAELIVSYEFSFANSCITVFNFNKFSFKVFSCIFGAKTK